MVFIVEYYELYFSLQLHLKWEIGALHSVRIIIHQKSTYPYLSRINFLVNLYLLT